MEWRKIEEMAEEMRDGREVYVRRIYNGRPVAEGYAVFGVCRQNAPQREPLGLDPLNRLSASDYAAEDRERSQWAETAKWLKPDRMYSFPTPTHYCPAPPMDEEG